MNPEKLWDRLAGVRSLRFVARSQRPTGWNGTGVGTVEVRQPNSGVMTFHERGVWQPEGNDRELTFTNTYRWSLDGEMIRLEHLRFGENHPVYLFDLVSDESGKWRSGLPHLCGEDCYSAVLSCCESEVVLRWSIDGPRMRETIEYTYV